LYEHITLSNARHLLVKWRALVLNGLFKHFLTQNSQSSVLPLQSKVFVVIQFS
jgi:hypothetical protein